MDAADFNVINSVGRISLCAGKYPMISIKAKNHYVHRLVLFGASEVDHINGEKTDNRSSNLRPVTRSQNHMNRRISKSNPSGVSGVRYCKGRKKWYSQITINKKVMFLGRFDDQSDAIAARLIAQEKYFGEYARKESK